MTIFNSFTVANDYNFGARWPNGRGRHFFLATNKTFEGVCSGAPNENIAQNHFNIALLNVF